MQDMQDTKTLRGWIQKLFKEGAGVDFVVLPVYHFTVPGAILKGSQAFASKQGWS
jgi:hypothetical protein